MDAGGESNMQDAMLAAPTLPETRRPRRVQSSPALVADLDASVDIRARVFHVGAAQRGVLLGLARRRLRRADLDEDGVQEALIQAAGLCERAEVSAPGAIFGMLTKCVEWKAKDANRTGLRAPQPVADLDHDVAMIDTAPDELTAAVADLLAQVPECDREALLLRACYQLSYREVSARTGQTQRRAALAVERTLERMRDLYSSREAGSLCEQASALLPKLQAGTLADEVGTDEARRIAAHARGCLRCQREQRFYQRGLLAALAPGVGAAGLGMGALGVGAATAVVASLPAAPLAASTIALLAAGALIPILAVGPALHHDVPVRAPARTAPAPTPVPERHVLRIAPRRVVRPIVPPTTPHSTPPVTGRAVSRVSQHANPSQEFLP